MNVPPFGVFFLLTFSLFVPHLNRALSKERPDENLGSMVYRRHLLWKVTNFVTFKVA